MTPDLVLQTRGILGQKKDIRLGDRESWVLAGAGSGDVVVSGLADDGSAAIYQEDDQWIIMAIKTSFQLNGQDQTSGDLSAGDELTIGNSVFTVKDRSVSSKQKVQKIEKEATSSSNKTRIALLGFLLFAVMFAVFLTVTPSSKTTVQEAELDIAKTDKAVPSDKDESPAVDVSSRRDQDETPPASKAEASPAIKVRPSFTDDGTYEYYRKALNYYDLGFLQPAIETLQSGLVAYPGDSILAKKLDDWQQNLSSELSKQFRDGCLHARYFRNLEARHSFAIVVEMSFDKSDIRFKEANRLLEKLKQDSSARVECGRNTDEN